MAGISGHAGNGPGVRLHHPRRAPALYAIWFRVRPLARVKNTEIEEEMRAAAQSRQGWSRRYRTLPNVDGSSWLNAHINNPFHTMRRWPWRSAAITRSISGIEPLACPRIPGSVKDDRGEPLVRCSALPTR